MGEECWYKTSECPENPIDDPLRYAIDRYYSEQYEYYACNEIVRYPDGSRDPAYPDGTEDRGTMVWSVNPNTGAPEYSIDKTRQNGKFEICCMGLVEQSLKLFPAIDYLGFDRGKDFNHETWCVPDNPGPGDLALYVNTKNPKEGHVDFVFDTPTRRADGLLEFRAFGAMSSEVNVDFRDRTTGISGQLQWVTFLRPKVEKIAYDCKDPDKPQATGRTPPPDPLLIDLNGGGISTIGISSGIHLDNDGNGFKELSGWVAPGDGMLTLDKNGNGRLDNAGELFGDFMILPDGTKASSGFEALKYFDANGDSKIDVYDPIWSQLRIWQYDDAELYDWGVLDASTSSAGGG